MGAWKTLFLTIPLCLATLALATSATGQTAATDDLRTLTVCAGRLSALMEHQWLTDGPASEATARSREAMLSLVDAVLPEAEASRALGWRIDAKAAHAALLSRASFGRDPTAARRAEYLIQQCLALIGQS